MNDKCTYPSCGCNKMSGSGANLLLDCDKIPLPSYWRTNPYWQDNILREKVNISRIMELPEYKEMVEKVKADLTRDLEFIVKTFPGFGT